MFSTAPVGVSPLFLQEETQGRKHTPLACIPWPQNSHHLLAQSLASRSHRDTLSWAEKE